jgi:hypothetical protein
MLQLIETKETEETKALYRNMYLVSQKAIKFGHQSATEYGHGWSGDKDRSDVKSVTGSHLAVIGAEMVIIYLRVKKLKVISNYAKAPFLGHLSASDFIKFYNDPYTIFEKDLPKMYKSEK